MTPHRKCALLKELIAHIQPEPDKSQREIAAEVIGLSRGAIDKACTPNDQYFLSWDYVVKLEEFVGVPVLTRAWVSRPEFAEPSGHDVMEAALSVNETAAHLAHEVYRATHPASRGGRAITQSERDEIHPVLDAAEASLRRTRASLEGGAHLHAVPKHAAE